MEANKISFHAWSAEHMDIELHDKRNQLRNDKDLLIKIA